MCELLYPRPFSLQCEAGLLTGEVDMTGDVLMLEGRVGVNWKVKGTSHHARAILPHCNGQLGGCLATWLK